MLPAAIREASIHADDEWVIPLPEVKQAIHLASEHLIAVLGVESFRILENGLGGEGFSVYIFDFGRDWPTYVCQNNEAAGRFIEENQLGQGYGYILTTVSEDEFNPLGMS